ncbi:hypothetical protein CP533_6338 [Ophiocordyceps camponoti-saundersi (nom. inval.)]|nr:hypothetical protein CP533_6338 [Ophiocordyceps camponoti-saundersi (nom. inval.)]
MLSLHVRNNRCTCSPFGAPEREASAPASEPHKFHGRPLRAVAPRAAAAAAAPARPLAMYEDSWYSFVSDVATSSKPATAAAASTSSSAATASAPAGGNRRRNLSRPQQLPEPDALTDKIRKDDFEDEGDDSPPEPELRRRPASISDLFSTFSLESRLDKLRLYEDQLTLTERHLDGLIDDANAALELLASLSRSFQSVEAQTTSFRSRCEDLLNEQHRLERLAHDVGTDLHYYAYLETATRRLNAPGASRLVEDDAFGDMVANIDACIGFMNNHVSYRERDSYLARYNALLTKALHLLDHGFTARLDSISADIGRQIAATKSESARHALAYGRFEEILSDSYALLPNIRKVVRCAYDQYGRSVEESSTTSPVSVYANTVTTMFNTYLTTRDRDLKPMTQRDADEFQKEMKTLSVETACRNFIKQSLDKVYDEDGLFVTVFGIDPTWSSSAFQVVKAVHTTMAHPGYLAPVATAVKGALQTAQLQTICDVVGWLAREYSISEVDDDETPATRRYREYAARLLVEHLWPFTDDAFAVEVTKTITKAAVQDATLKTDGVSAAKAFPPVGHAIKLLAMFDHGMPKERSAKNSVVVFNIVRETIRVLQRAEARIRSIKTGTDADLFMIQNLLMLKNELFSLEIGDIRSQPQSMQHFVHIWDTLSPQNWMGFFSSVLGGSLWSRGAPAVTAKTLTAEDMSEQLDELLRQSIYAFTRRWGALVDEAQGRAAMSKVEAELEGLLRGAFDGQPEVVSKLKEAIRLNAQAQTDAREAKRGAKRDQNTMTSKEMKTYRGNCHCGAIVFEVDMAEIEAARACNCSICHKKGYLWLSPEDETRLRFVKGSDESMTGYTFGPKKIKHQFCPTCATPLMARNDEAAPGKRLVLNAHAIQGLNTWNLKIEPFNGAAIGAPYGHPEFKGDLPEPAHDEGASTTLYTGGCHCGRVGVAVASQPFDIIKVRLQTTNRYKGAFEAATSIYKSEGPLAFYKGTLTPLIGIGACVSLQFGAFHFARRWFEARSHNKDAHKLNLSHVFLSGAFAGVINASLSSPIEHIRIRLQSQPHDPSSRLYSGPVDCARKIAVEAGGLLPALYKGTCVTLLREASAYGAWFAAFEALMTADVDRNRRRDRAEVPAWKVAVYGGLAGEALWLVSYPFDVVKSKMQTDGFGVTSRYPTMRSCFVHTWQQGGFAAFWKGIWPTLFRAMPVSAGTFAVVEMTRRAIS